MHLLNDLFDSMDTSNASLEAAPKPQSVREYEPNHHYLRKGQEAQLEVEMPGVQQDDIEIELKGNKLAIVGKRYRHEKRKETIGDKDAESERLQASAEDMESDDGTKAEEGHDANMLARKLIAVYRLGLKVAPTVDVDGIRAKHCNGILSLHIPLKAPVHTSRHIEISQD